MPKEPSVSQARGRRERTRLAYDRLSRWYGVIADPWERPCRRAGLDLLAPAEGERLLEVGFGTGQALVDLARAAGPAGRVCGVDLSPGMARAAQARVARARLAARVGLLCGDAARLPFPAGSFDAVFVSFTLELFEACDLPWALEECRRVLAPGGRLCVVALSGARSGPMARLYRWCHERFPEYVDCRPIPVQRLLAEARFHVLAVREMSLAGLSVDAVLAARESDEPERPECA